MNQNENKIVRETFRPVVGIDLGTTNSAVAYIHRGRPEIIPSPRGERIIPSVVLIDLKGNIVVGEDARAALIAMPDRTVAAVKRKMGSGERITAAGKEFLPQEISALILKELKKYVDTRFGEGEKEAVITVPAYFNDDQRRATKQAGELAGFLVERIINEPTAAALAFGLEHLGEDRHILVYDLGGGTFDVSIVEMMDGVLEVKASAGNSRLGGEDFDWKVVDWLAEQVINEHGIDPRNDIRAKALLKEESEKIKKRLSEEESVTVSLPMVMVKDNGPAGLFKEFTRHQLVGIIGGLLSQTLDCVRQVLKDADLAPEDIHEILLVGGSTRIPRVRELIIDFFGKEPRTDIHPDEAVALGAAVQAGLKSGALSGNGLVVTDVAPFSMGIAVLKEWEGLTVKPGGFQAIIPRNTTIPVTRSDVFYTAADGQTAASIEIYQGEHEWVRKNHRLGEFLLEGIPPNRAGKEAIEVTYRYNLNGILEVTARCVSNGRDMSVTVQDALNRDSQEVFEESRARLEELCLGAGSGDLDDDVDEEDVDLFDGMSGYDSACDAGEEEDLSPTVLHSEAAALRSRAVELLEKTSGSDKLNVEKIIGLLDEAMSGDDIDRLQSAIDEAADALIDLEF